MAYLKSQRREFEKNQSDSSQILVAEQALSYIALTIIVNCHSTASPTVDNTSFSGTFISFGAV